MGITYTVLFLTLFIYIGLPILAVISLIKVVDWQIEQSRQRRLRYEYYEKKSQKKKEILISFPFSIFYTNFFFV
ncbi:hypothetical protein ABE65_012850 [Fictibacillus phosphorivorans]|uniref:Uncharacterized protein n=1 Tax=Fictibacillus phosphorivorans TaxID=1221500 RepID=A0A160INN3_9BACL|nr:hypothetical protein ABE65_012850 [Fictibacillus phosphorivorans]